SGVCAPCARSPETGTHRPPRGHRTPGCKLQDKPISDNRPEQVLSLLAAQQSAPPLDLLPNAISVSGSGAQVLGRRFRNPAGARSDIRVGEGARRNRAVSHWLFLSWAFTAFASITDPGLSRPSQVSSVFIE